MGTNSLKLITHKLLLTLVASLTAAEVSGQPSLDELLIDTRPRQGESPLLTAYQREVEELEARSNTYDPQLGETLHGMANTLRMAGEYSEALEAYRRAMHIQRVNHGIYSLAQEPMIRGMIATHQQTDNLAGATRQYQQLLRIHTRSHGDNSPELLPLLDEVSDWHLRAYAQDPSPGAVFHLAASHSLLEHAIAIAESHGQDSDIKSIRLLRDMVATNYYLAQHHSYYGGKTSDERFTFTTRTGPEAGPEAPSREEMLMINSYRSGRMAQERIVDKFIDDPGATPRQKAEALAELGDWHLLFGRHHSAREVYETSWRVMEEAGASRQELVDFFGHPRMLQPGIEEESGSLPMQYARAVFSINRRGSARDIEILEVFPETDESLASEALNTLKSVKFRPRLEDGQVADTEQYAVKLHLNQPETQ